MGAFNRRLEPKQMYGIPLVSMLGIIGLLAFGLLIFMLPFFFLKILVGIGLLASVGMVVIGFWLGEEWPLRGVIFAAWRERERVTSETWTDE